MKDKKDEETHHDVCPGCGGAIFKTIGLTSNACNDVVVMLAPDHDADEDSSNSPELMQIVCWALVEYNGQTAVHPMVCANGEIVDATEFGNYMGVASVDEVEAVGDQLLIEYREAMDELVAEHRAAMTKESDLA
jgi:hypothetical protein